MMSMFIIFTSPAKEFPIQSVKWFIIHISDAKTLEMAIFDFRVWLKILVYDQPEDDVPQYGCGVVAVAATWL